MKILGALSAHKRFVIPAVLLVVGGLIILALIIVANQGDDWNGQTVTTEISMRGGLGSVLFRDGAKASTPGSRTHHVSVSFSTRTPQSVLGVMRIQDPSFLTELGKGIFSNRWVPSGPRGGDIDRLVEDSYRASVVESQFRLKHISDILELAIYKGSAQNKSVIFEAGAEHPATHDLVFCQFTGFEDGERLSGDFTFTVTDGKNVSNASFEGAGNFSFTRQHRSYFPFLRVVFPSRDQETGGQRGSNSGNQEHSGGSNSTPPKFGVAVKVLTDVQRNDIGIKNGNGIQVTGVESGSFAEDIGFAAKDVVVSTNRQSVTSIEDLRRIQSMLKPGDPVAFHIFRQQANGQWVSLYVSGVLPQDSR